jgi:RNAse (barnase) inhibitor barstar
VTAGVVRDNGGRNLDALNDDLRDLAEPLTILWADSGRARAAIGDWFEKCVDVLRVGEPGDQPVQLLLR